LLSPSDVFGARRVAVVNETLAKTFFGDDEPIGHQIKFNVLDQMPEAPHDAYFEIVGVVNDLLSFQREPSLPQAYVPYTFSGFGDRSLVVRTVTNPALLANNLGQVLADVDANIVLVHPETLEDQLNKFVYMKPKFRLISFSICAGIGLGLALIGLFGVTVYSVTLQTHELGVRMALGAHSRNILTLVLGKGLLLVGGGIFVGILTSFFTVRVLQSQLWGVSAFDPWTLILAPSALLDGFVGLLSAGATRDARGSHDRVALRIECCFYGVSRRSGTIQRYARGRTPNLGTTVSPCHLDMFILRSRSRPPFPLSEVPLETRIRTQVVCALS